MYYKQLGVLVKPSGGAIRSQRLQAWPHRGHSHLQGGGLVAVAVSMVVAALLLGDPLSSSSASGGPGAMLTSSSEHEARFASKNTSTQEDSKQVRPLLINVKDHGDNLPNQKTTSVCVRARVSSSNHFIFLGTLIFIRCPPPRVV